MIICVLLAYDVHATSLARLVKRIATVNGLSTTLAWLLNSYTRELRLTLFIRFCYVSLYFGIGKSVTTPLRRLATETSRIKT